MPALPVVLDVTRSVARAGRPVPSGIDRVERAYLDWALARGGAWLLCRTGGRQHVVAPDRAGAVAAALDGGAGGWRWALAAVPTLRRRAARSAAEAAVRGAAAVTAEDGSPGKALDRLVPEGTPCLFVGHENLSEATMRGLAGAGLAPVAMIHDTIPLDFPEHSGPGALERFATAFRAMLGAAHLLSNSRATLADAGRNAAALGLALPPATVLPLGIAPVAGAAGTEEGRPYFVMLGTIEGRKNHLLALRVWERLEAPAPVLDVVGPRGWAADAAIAALEPAAARGAVRERGALGDGETAALLRGARALLVPSLAEGYGLPLAEALAMGVPVIASDLPALREVGGEVPEWLDPADEAGWLAAVREYAGEPSARREAQLGRLRGWRAPGWEAHFAGLERVLGSLRRV